MNTTDEPWTDQALDRVRRHYRDHDCPPITVDQAHRLGCKPDACECLSDEPLSDVQAARLIAAIVAERYGS
jgi:hypothetical protein